MIHQKAHPPNFASSGVRSAERNEPQWPNMYNPTSSAIEENKGGDDDDEDDTAADYLDNFPGNCVKRKLEGRPADKE